MGITDDRWMKPLWFVNGVLLVVFLVLVGGLIVHEQFFGPRSPRREEPVVLMPDTARPADSLAARAVRYSEPVDVLGTDTRLIRVAYGTEFTPPGYFGLRDEPFDLYRGFYLPYPIVNVMFLDSSGVRLLLDRPAFVQDVDFPSQPDDSLQSWIAYELALEDTNGDGKLSERDVVTLYVSDLDGRRLRHVLPPHYRVVWHTSYMDGRAILISALEMPSTGATLRLEQLPQRSFLYYVASDSLAPYRELNEVISRTGQLLSR